MFPSRNSAVCAVRYSVLMLVIVALQFPAPVYAQRESASVGIGDIIRYKTRPGGGAKYGLVLNVARFWIEVENVDGVGDFDDDRISTTSPMTKWVVVDRYKRKSAGTLRVWKSNDGKFEIKAKMTKADDENVWLEKSDGDSVRVPISKLSSKDRQHVTKQLGKFGNDELFSDTDDIPNDVLMLQDRRRELLDEDNRHQRLAKLNPNLMVGDILKIQDMGKEDYGLVIDIGNPVRIETVTGGKLRSQMLFGIDRWSYFDREFIAMPLESRTWKSADDKFSVKARLVSIDGDDLTLEKNNRETVKVPLDRLSKIDQNYVQRSRGQLTARNDEEIQRERQDYGERLQTLLTRRGEILKRELDNRVAAKAAFKMKNIRLNAGPIELSSSQLQPTSLSDSVDFSFSFPLRVVENASLKNIRYAHEAEQIALSASSPFRGKPTLAVVNLNDQRVVTNIDSDDVGEDGAVVAFSPSGETILVFSGDFRDKQLELWKHQDERLVRKSLVSYESSRPPAAHLFSDEKGVILNSDGDLVFFDVTDRIIPTHQVASDSRFSKNRLQISDDGNTVFFFDSTSSKLHVIDAEAKKCIGGISLPQPDARIKNSLAQVSGDGKTVIYLVGSKLMIYSMETGKLISEYERPSRSMGAAASHFISTMPEFAGMIGSFQYLGSGVTLSGSSVFEMELGLEVATIDRGTKRGAQHFANGARIVGDLDGPNVTSARVNSIMGAAREGRPDAKTVRELRNQANYGDAKTELSVQRLPIDEIIAHAKSIGGDDIVDFGKGDTLQLKFKLNNQKNLERQLRTKIESTMGEHGIKVVDQSDFVLECLFKVGERQNRTYRIVGWGPPRTRNVSFVPKTCSAKLIYKGEVIWAKSESASLGRPSDEGDLDKSLQRSREITARNLLEFEYPGHVRVVLPSRKQQFRWE